MVVVYVQISQFVWDENIIEHIARHNVTPEEIEEVCFGYPLIIKSKQAAKGINPIYYVLGQTDSGRHLFIVIIYFKQGRAMVITARNMDQGERKRYQRRFTK